MTCDYVVIGAGSAGCVLASWLSTDPQCSVLRLEAGPPDIYPWIHIPIGYAKTMFNPRVNWCFYTEPDPGMNGRKIYWPWGKTLGVPVRSTDSYRFAANARTAMAGRPLATRAGATPTCCKCRIICRHA